MDRRGLKYLVRSLFITVTVFTLLHCPARNAGAEMITPEKYFGFEPGADGMLFNYEQLIDYLKVLDGESPSLKLVEIGKSPMGKFIYIAFISSPSNIENLRQLREINRKLANDPALDEKELESIVKDGKVFFMATLSMHSNEVGPSQAAPKIAYELLTTEDPERLKWLDDVVFMMNPCHNPDGMDMIVEHYQKYRGTKYEGSRMPGVYHKYVGHDNNRDFVTLTQSDTKAISNVLSNDWYPHVMIEKHQMGSSGVRYFVPPNHDPIAENVDAGLWNWMGIFGSNMIKDMTQEGLSGVAQHYLFDDYWPGSTETSIWKNVISLLTEAASVLHATPIYIEPNELSVHGKGLSEYKKSINMPLLWEGGWWRLSDIVEYEKSSTYSMLRTSSLHREAILRFRNELCRREVEKGSTTPPYYYILPASRERQHDLGELARVVYLLKEHGIKVYRAGADLPLGQGCSVAKGDIVIPLAQPVRAFIKEVMESQEYPVRHYTPGGEIIKPYDITSWSIPLHSGLVCEEIDARSDGLESSLELVDWGFSFLTGGPERNNAAAVFFAENNESYKIVFRALSSGLKVFRLDETVELNGTAVSKGSFVIPIDGKNFDKYRRIRKGLLVEPLYIDDDLAGRLCRDDLSLDMPRIALVETNFHDMDAGWTRYLFDSYGIPFDPVKTDRVEGIDLGKYDLIIFPDNEKSILMKGKYESRGGYFSGSYPPEYLKGLGEKGFEKILGFIDEGGKAIAWGRSTALFDGSLSIGEKEDKEEFTLPFRDLSQEMEKSGLYCPGSLVRVLLKKDHPLTLGMGDEAGVFFRGKPVFATSIPRFDMDRRVIAKFPEKDILLSGYAENISEAGNRSAMVWLKKGKGELVLFSFNPQFRASTPGTFKLLFNSLLLP
ncbi:MAG: hypothetical protein JW814_12610 [Candidatus Krumholzibacteriota bacterium]|nr:hypothetical protein [Candidatus Krumholzibacteriota bacterium]